MPTEPVRGLKAHGTSPAKAPDLSIPKVVLTRGSSGLVIAVRDKGQAGDMSGARGAAHLEEQRRALAGMGGIDIAHRHRGPDRGAKPAARHPADRVSGVIEDRCPLARR